ncbi:demethoxyubiquinone hydroxylase family protein [Pseudomonas sp. gcc21]|uniref:demethoxyubiquinone hydroxylase family protein n=1 Tax=Pseudomonas sp. gcc21 TaxID=2726989 RepID=UPI001451C525|nr:demethoxyubiquinone hydroxylase family protein [Pseudomonas sp. gcc21]QJD59757.1 demethoxyubiquinone hydroxylase family protein [Pseudomonas sp. gcc21]
MKEIERIIRVDHAGERGAISIYSAQLTIARFLYKDMVPVLEDMLSHEREHYLRFDLLLKARGIRQCYGLVFWRVGEAVLGTVTALLGRNAVWVCTDSIETTVLHHLQWQLDFLEMHDTEAHAAVLSIKRDEENHQNMGQQNGTQSLVYKPIFGLVKQSTRFAIWLSTKL